MPEIILPRSEAMQASARCRDLFPNHCGALSVTGTAASDYATLTCGNLACSFESTNPAASDVWKSFEPSGPAHVDYNDEGAGL